MYDMMMDGLKDLGLLNDMRFQISPRLIPIVVIIYKILAPYRLFRLWCWVLIPSMTEYAVVIKCNVMPYIQSVDRYIMPTIDTETITLERAQEEFLFLALRTKWGP